MANKAQLKREANYQRERAMADMAARVITQEECALLLGTINLAEQRQERIPVFYDELED